jgi:hypothetical protein
MQQGVDTMRPDIIQRTVEYWSSQRDGRKLAMRRSIDPAELADLLANLVLVEVLDGGRDYLHRIAGEAAASLLGADLMGRRLSEFKMMHTLIHGGMGSILPAHLKRRIWWTSRQTMGLIVRLRLSSC